MKLYVQLYINTIADIGICHKDSEAVIRDEAEIKVEDVQNFICGFWRHVGRIVNYVVPARDYGRKIRLDFVTSRYSTIFSCMHRTT